MGNEECMAFNQNIAQEYNRNKILTASPAELTLMLYEGAIKFCNIAIVAIEKKDYEKANINIKKAENIITEFKVTLNHKYAVAEDFEKIYANMSKDIEVLNRALDEIRGMRDTWKEVMKRAKSTNQ